MLRGIDLSLDSEGVWPEDEEHLELVTGSRQLIDTNDVSPMWYIDLEDRIFPLEFNPWQRAMPIYPTRHYWMRQDVTILAKDLDTPQKEYIIRTVMSLLIFVTML